MFDLILDESPQSGLALGFLSHWTKNKRFSAEWSVLEEMADGSQPKWPVLEETAGTRTDNRKRPEIDDAR